MNPRPLFFAALLVLLLLHLSAAPSHATALPRTQRDATPSPAPTCPWLPALPAAARPLVRFKTARNVVFFTDGTNFDDIVTILFLLKSRTVNLLAIYIQGNAFSNPGSSLRIYHNILHMFGPSYNPVPIYAGSYYALIDDLNASFQSVTPTYRAPIPFGPSGILYADTMHGTAHFLPQGPRAYDIRNSPDSDERSIPALFDLIEALPADLPVTFLSTGTLTPIAKMFLDPYLARFEPILNRVDALYVMGGSVDDPGNLFTLPSNLKAEFNIYNDPHAADWAFGNLSARGKPVFLVGLDATNDVPIRESLLTELRDSPRTPEAQLVGHLMTNLRDTWFAPDLFFETAFLWDPSAAIVMAHESVVKNMTERDIRVVLEEGPLGPNQAWTKPCTKAEVDLGICYKVFVVQDLKPALVTKKLLDALQQPQNSACLPLVCL